MKKAASFGLVVGALSLAQFIMTVDTTIMNVSIPTLVSDLETSVGSVQAAISLYALIMAAFMLLGSKLGEIHGRKKIFQIGLVIYGIGSAITAVAPNIGVLIFGWSVLEGIGASLMMPAMMALISINFTGKQRVAALSITAGVAGAAAAVGPIIGGALSTYATWRYAFVAEVIIAIATLFMSRYIIDNAKLKNEKIDMQGTVLAASGLAMFVFGVLQASEYGWIRASKPFELFGVEISPFGLSIVPILCGLGLMLLWQFFRVEKKRKENKQPILLDVELFNNIPLKTGLNIVLITQLALGGIMFIMPLFLQLVLGFNAMRTGTVMLPISIALVLASVFTTKASARYGAVRTIRAAQSLLVLSLFLLAFQISNDTGAGELVVPFLSLGAAIGFIIPLNQSILLGSVKSKDSSQVAGLNYTFQQLGMSLGTAVIGSVLLFSLGSGVVNGLSSSSEFNQSEVEQNSIEISSGIEFLSNDQLLEGLEGSDLTQEQKNDLVTVNSEARLRALRVAIAVSMVLAILALQSSGRMKDALEKA